MLKKSKSFRICAILFQKDEDYLLPIWISYYSLLVGPENIVIIDNGSSNEISIKILHNAEANGSIVIRKFNEPSDFAKKGEVTSLVINERMKDFDAFLPLDCDEFLFCSTVGGRQEIPSRHHLNHTLAQVFNDNSEQFCRVDVQYDNVPGSSQLFKANTKKIAVRSGDPVSLDSGFHMYDWNTKRDRVRLAASPLGLFHFHNRPYADLLRRSREKLKTRLPDFRASTLKNYKGQGRHLVRHFNRGSQLPAFGDDRIDISAEWSRLNIGHVPFSEVIDTSVHEIDEGLDHLNFYAIADGNVEEAKNLQELHTLIAASSSVVHLGVSPAISLMSQTGRYCSAIVTSPDEAWRLSKSNITGPAMACGWLVCECHIPTDVRMPHAPRQHMSRKHLDSMCARLSRGTHDTVFFSGEFRLLAAAYYVLNSETQRTCIYVIQDKDLEIISMLADIKLKVGRYIFLSLKSGNLDSARKLLLSETRYWSRD